MPECPLPTRLRHTADQFEVAKERGPFFTVALPPEACGLLAELLTNAAETIERLQFVILQQPPTSHT